MCVCVCVWIQHSTIDTAIQPESYDDEFDAKDNGNRYEKDDAEHDDLASPPGSLTSGWRAGGMQGKAQGSLSCRPELDPALAEVEPADYIPICFRIVRNLESLTNMHWIIVF